MKISTVILRGETRYKLTTTSGGKRKRQFFLTMADAVKEQKAILKTQEETGKGFAVLSATEKTDAFAFIAKIRASGHSYEQVMEILGGKPNAPKASLTLAQAIKMTVDAKTKAKLSEDYVKGLGLYLKLFACGRETLPISSINEDLIEEWFNERDEGWQTRKSNLGRLSSMFGYCWRKKYISENPCKRVEKVKEITTFPRMLTRRQYIRCVIWARRRNPKFLAWVVLALFAGVRPECEGDNLDWPDVDLERKRIKVEGDLPKTGRSRIIDLSLCPPALEWLKVAKAIGSPLKYSHSTRRRYLRQLREYLGFKTWPQDILRHTAAANMLGFHQDAGKVANFLGNSAGILLKNYTGGSLVYKEDAERFMKLLPKPRHFLMK